jgi:hypothetical protein
MALPSNYGIEYFVHHLPCGNFKISMLANKLKDIIVEHPRFRRDHIQPLLRAVSG